MIGYREESGSRVYRVYDENSKQVLLTRDVVFDQAAEISTPLTTPSTTIESEPEGLFVPTDEKDRCARHKERAEQRKTLSEEEDKESPGETLPPIDP